MKKKFFKILCLVGVLACIIPLAKVNLEKNVTERKITAEIAYEGVNNYCHSAYDWDVVKDNPSIMYVKMGEDTESEYQVIFRSYTGSFVYFYVNKLNGIVRIIDKVPTLGVESEEGTFNLYDYLKNDN
ncbi:MAG: hypothetical protein J6Y29_02875 [Clostridiales bacterium]|nr:hypothetical protein [Clostridiales bacterium]